MAGSTHHPVVMADERLLPFRLIRPTDKHWGPFVDWSPPTAPIRGPQRRGRNTPAENERLAKADVADIRDHGFDLIVINYYLGAKENPDGTFTYGLGNLPRDMELFKALGKDVPVVVCFEYFCRDMENAYADDKPHVPGHFSPKARKAVVGMVKRIHDEAIRNGWPKTYFAPIDEPGNNKTENRYSFAEAVLDCVHEVPGCQTAVTVGASDVQRLGEKRIDVRIYAFGSYKPSKAIADAKAGYPFWYYVNSMFYGRSTTASRSLAGFTFLRSGAEVASAWGFAAYQDNPYNSFDGGNPQLDVERANTITAGVVWTPKSITGLSLTLDFYDIKISNTISSFAPDDTIRACASNGWWSIR